MPTIHLIEGPVGAGKSTFAARLGEQLNAPRINLDEWMVTLFSPDRPAENFVEWYLTCKQRCIEQIWRVACDWLDCRSDIILELGLVQQADRAEFYQRVDDHELSLKVYLLDVPREVRLERVRQRNATRGQTFQMAVSDEVFDIADRAWQAPDDAETSERDIQWISP